MTREKRRDSSAAYVEGRPAGQAKACSAFGPPTTRSFIHAPSEEQGLVPCEQHGGVITLRLVNSKGDRRYWVAIRSTSALSYN